MYITAMGSKLYVLLLAHIRLARMNPDAPITVVSDKKLVMIVVIDASQVRPFLSRRFLGKPFYL
jgi:hypothetical protein